MLEKILFIGGEQDGRYNSVRRTQNRVAISVYRPLDFTTLTGIVSLDRRPIRIDEYVRTEIDGVGCFCLENLSSDEIRERWLKS
jgi:hypothetical protein